PCRSRRGPASPGTSAGELRRLNLENREPGDDRQPDDPLRGSRPVEAVRVEPGHVVDPLVDQGVEHEPGPERVRPERRDLRGAWVAAQVVEVVVDEGGRGDDDRGAAPGWTSRLAAHGRPVYRFHGRNLAS